MSKGSAVVLLVSCTLAVAAYVALLGLATSKSNNTRQQEDDNDDESLDEEHLPPHLRREIHKEKRRQASVRFLAMKSPMYDNIQMFAPDDKLLCTISQKKANWYIRKELACWKGNGQTSIKLNFSPKGRSLEPDLYTTSRKQNVCVCCGDTKDHMRHYVIPYSYRQLLPEKYKTHMPHDIVILCPDCNLTCKQYTQKRQKFLERALRTDPVTEMSVIPCRKLQQVRSKALALYKHRDKLPRENVQQYERLIREYNNLAEGQELTSQLLKENSEMEAHSPNPKYIPGARLVVDQLESDDLIADFVRDWRTYFIETMQPRYLPKGWDISNPVHSDNRT